MGCKNKREKQKYATLKNLAELICGNSIYINNKLVTFF
jgi:hypothetical protein